MKHLYIIALAVFMLGMILTGCGHTPPPETLSPSVAISTPEESTPAPTPEETPEPTSTPEPFVVPEHEVELVAKTLRGECYDDQPGDKRDVVRVIVNRVSDGSFGDNVEAVITAPRQFNGYRAANVPTQNDYEIAREILTEWYEGGCVALGEYLFFTSGGGRKNVFRKEWKESGK